MMGAIISSAVLPATLTLLWSDQSWAAVTFSQILGFICSMTPWLVRTEVKYGELTVDTTGSVESVLVGNIVFLLTPVAFIPLLTYILPFKLQKYNLGSMYIRKVGDHDVSDEVHMVPERVPGEHRPAAVDEEQNEIKLDNAAKDCPLADGWCNAVPADLVADAYILQRLCI